MKNFKVILFLIFILLYSVGIVAGCIGQVGTENQRDMYEYLEGAVSGYDTSANESIKAVFSESIKIMGLIAIGGFFLLGPLILCFVMLMKGYATGFAITTILRLFGMRGLLFCGANLVSSAIIIPAIAWYSCQATSNILNNRYERKDFIKRYILLIVIMIPVFLADSVLRGLLSSILIKFASSG